MNTIIERYDKIKLNISNINIPKQPNIIAVSKTFPMESHTSFDRSWTYSFWRK